jgi:hypothetical protein
VVPTGVNVSEFRAGAGTTAVDPIVVFLGSMDWEANIDAVDTLPGHLAGRSCCRARAIPDRGRNPHPRPEAGVHVGRGDWHGACCLDHLKETAVFVVPLRIGAGTRLKIFRRWRPGVRSYPSIGAEGSMSTTDGTSCWPTRAHVSPNR